jgi:uncharacterized protein (TIGR02172 family)
MADSKLLRLCGRVDSANAAQVEANIWEALGEELPGLLVLDAAELTYISSAGLRVLLHLRKAMEVRLTNANSEIYDILEMTGFTEMMKVERALRSVSVEGCEEIGHGANGSVYRLAKDTVVKVFRNPNAAEEIFHERENAKLALILGIPTAISYDVVRVGEGYGTVYELLNARSFSKIIANEPTRFDWCVREFTDLLKKIHGTQVPAGKLPDMKQTVLGWARFLLDHLPAEAGKKLLALVEAVPADDHMIHGDYHTKNVELQNDEVLLIDMDTLAVGNRIFELGSIYNSFIGFYELDPEGIRRFQGFDFETSRRFWRAFLAAYLDTRCEAKLREVEDKARILGYARLIRRGIRRGAKETERGRAELEHWTGELLELLDRIDELTFSRNELIVPARVENLDVVQAFAAERVGEVCSPKTQMQLDLAVEEIFVNIASYAYAPKEGMAAMQVQVSGDPPAVSVTFRDRGVPYDPLAKEDPDVTALAAERKVGGLGIFLTKQLMDEVRYEYKDGQNVLTMFKKL